MDNKKERELNRDYKDKGQSFDTLTCAEQELKEKGYKHVVGSLWRGKYNKEAYLCKRREAVYGYNGTLIGYEDIGCLVTYADKNTKPKLRGY